MANRRTRRRAFLGVCPRPPQLSPPPLHYTRFGSSTGWATLAAPLSRSARALPGTHCLLLPSPNSDALGSEGNRWLLQDAAARLPSHGARRVRRGVVGDGVRLVCALGLQVSCSNRSATGANADLRCGSSTGVFAVPAYLETCGVDSLSLEAGTGSTGEESYVVTFVPCSTRMNLFASLRLRCAVSCLRRR